MNCWRGYQAIYKIENDSLFLVNIIGCGEIFYEKGKIDLKKSNDNINTIFGSKFKNGKVYMLYGYYPEDFITNKKNNRVRE